MNKEKQILKVLNKNDALYEAIYCAVVSDNDFIRDLKQEIKDYQKDNNFNEELKNSIIEHSKEQLKEYQTKRKQLKRAFYLLFDDKLEEYND